MDEPLLSPPWREAVRQLLGDGLAYGHTISKDRIAALLELKPPRTADEAREYDLAMLRGVTDIRTALLTEHRMQLATNRDGTYRVVMPTDQTAHSMEVLADDMARTLRKAALGVVYTNSNLLDDASRRENIDAQAKLAKLATIIDNEVPLLGWARKELT